MTLVGLYCIPSGTGPGTDRAMVGCGQRTLNKSFCTLFQTLLAGDRRHFQRISVSI